MATLAASVLTPWRPTELAGGLTFLTVYACGEFILRMPNPVAVPLAGVVGAGQISATSPAAGRRLCLVTRKICNLVLAETRDGDGRVARWTSKFSNLVNVLLLPWSGGTTFIGKLNLDIVVTGDRTQVLTIQFRVANFFAWRAGPRMT